MPDQESELQQFTTTAEVHQPQEGQLDQQRPRTPTHATHPTHAVLLPCTNHQPMPPLQDSLHENTTLTPAKDSLLSGFLDLCGRAVISTRRDLLH
ncbi:hypothetical protein E2C01_039527 [Portunus trituberculatus]|uniref:Uncharacterized protein n=1 Tax=Portunus trituberculatus TaxID=210409 RepID=A0A5B7FEY8_PORTR|nr:hypothetical protein [Portunus trituberculatus]